MISQHTYFSHSRYVSTARNEDVDCKMGPLALNDSYKIYSKRPEFIDVPEISNDLLYLALQK